VFDANGKRHVLRGKEGDSLVELLAMHEDVLGGSGKRCPATVSHWGLEQQHLAPPDRQSLLSTRLQWVQTCLHSVCTVQAWWGCRRTGVGCWKQ
jgi:hypothetical protein